MINHELLAQCAQVDVSTWSDALDQLNIQGAPRNHAAQRPGSHTWWVCHHGTADAKCIGRLRQRRLCRRTLSAIHKVQASFWWWMLAVSPFPRWVDWPHWLAVSVTRGVLSSTEHAATCGKFRPPACGWPVDGLRQQRARGDDYFATVYKLAMLDLQVTGVLMPYPGLESLYWWYRLRREASAR